MLAHGKSDTGPGLDERQIGVNMQGEQVCVEACFLNGASDTPPASVRWAVRSFHLVCRQLECVTLLEHADLC